MGSNPGRQSARLLFKCSLEFRERGDGGLLMRNDTPASLPNRQIPVHPIENPEHRILAGGMNQSSSFSDHV